MLAQDVAIVEPARSNSVQLDLFLETMDKIPAASYLLVVFMALVATTIVNYLFDAGVYLTLSAFPALMFSGLAANAVLVINGVTLSHDRAANTAIATCLGFVFLAIAIFACLHFWYRLNDEPRA